MKKLLYLLLMLPVWCFGQSDPAPSAPVAKPSTAYQQSDSTYIFQNSKWFHVINQKAGDARYAQLSGVVPGGLILSVSGTTATVTAGSWVINGVTYSKGTTTNITIPAADATQSRYVDIYATTSSTILGVNGTLSLTPVEPDVPDNTVIIGVIFIQPSGPTIVPSTGKYVTNGGNQPNITGNKGWKGTQTFKNSVYFSKLPFIRPYNLPHFSLSGDTVVQDTTIYASLAYVNSHYGGGSFVRQSQLYSLTTPNIIGDTLGYSARIVASPVDSIYYMQSQTADGNDYSVVDGNPHYLELGINTGATPEQEYIEIYGDNGRPDLQRTMQIINDNKTGIKFTTPQNLLDGLQLVYKNEADSIAIAKADSIAVGGGGTTANSVIQMPDTTAFSSYSGTAKVVALRDSVIGGGSVFVLLPKGSNIANGGTIFTAYQTDSLWYRQYDKTKGINVQWFGVKGDGTTLNNARLQAAFNMAGNINIPDGNYLVDASRNAVNIKSNTHLVLNKNAVIKTQANNNPYTYQTLYVNQAQNVSIEGGAVEGDKYTHTDTTGQHGFGISVYGSKNVSIKDMKLSKCWGDGLYIGADTVTLLLADTNIMVSNVTSTDNRRNGLSVTYVRGLRLNNCYFTNQGGGPATPSGIDIEPNSAQIVDNVKISDCSETGNLGSAISSFVNYTNAQVKNITIENNSASANGLYGLYLFSTYSGLMRDININGYITSSQTQYGAYIRNTKNVNISNMKISGLTSPIADFRIQTDSLLKIDHLSVTDTSTLTPGVYFVGGNFNCSILNSNIATVSDAVLSTNSTTDYDSEFLNNTISSTNAAGIKLFKQDALKINNCTVRNTGKEGINLTTLTNSVVSGNILSDNGAATNNTYSAIAINGTSTNNTISANTSYQGTLNTNKISYNLSLASGAGTNLVSNNNFTAGVTGTISNSGTGNTIVNPLTYTSTASQTYSSTIGWTGTTAPSGTTNHSYSWTQVGNMVTVRINLSYSVAGTALTAVTMVLPSDVPKPYQPPGFSSANNVVVYGAGDFSTSASAVGGSTNRVWLLANGTNTGFIAEILSSSSNATNVWVSFTYLTN